MLIRNTQTSWKFRFSRHRRKMRWTSSKLSWRWLRKSRRESVPHLARVSRQPIIWKSPKDATWMPRNPDAAETVYVLSQVTKWVLSHSYKNIFKKFPTSKVLMYLSRDNYCLGIFSKFYLFTILRSLTFHWQCHFKRLLFSFYFYRIFHFEFYLSGSDTLGP